MRLLDRISYGTLIAFTVLMAVAPIYPVPHLWEKIGMLFTGTLSRPIDIFDLFWHLFPAILLGLKFWRDRQPKKNP